MFMVCSKRQGFFCIKKRVFFYYLLEIVMSNFAFPFRTLTTKLSAPLTQPILMT